MPDSVSKFLIKPKYRGGISCSPLPPRKSGLGCPILYNREEREEEAVNTFCLGIQQWIRLKASPTRRGIWPGRRLREREGTPIDYKAAAPLGHLDLQQRLRLGRRLRIHHGAATLSSSSATIYLGDFKAVSSKIHPLFVSSLDVVGLDLGTLNSTYLAIWYLKPLQYILKQARGRDERTEPGWTDHNSTPCASHTHTGLAQWVRRRYIR